MREPASVAALEELGRVQLSANFYMRDFLYSEIANFHGLPNIPAMPDVAIEAGRELCQALLEPLQASFGRIAIRSAYRSPAINQYGSEHGYSCASNAANFGRHIWDRRGRRGMSRRYRLHYRSLVHGPIQRDGRLAEAGLVDP